MNFVLPTNNNYIHIKPIYNTNINTYTPYILHSLYSYYNNVKSQIIMLCTKETNLLINNFENITKIINPYEYLYSIIPNYKNSISKLNYNTKSYYNLLEIINNVNIFEIYKFKPLHSLCISPNFIDITDNINLLRSNSINNDITYCFNKIEHINVEHIKFDFIFFEMNDTDYDNIDTYTLNLIKIIIIIFTYQENNGISIIKINHTFYKQIVDILYIFSSIFNNAFIVKPDTCNITTFEKYIICRNYLGYNHDIYLNLITVINNLEKNQNIVSLIDGDAPYYFINKLNDINIIIGQQQLEIFNQIINILINKNKEEKIESIKKTNIQKCINMCEKFKIPYNNYFEKTNIFLQS